ncbi:MAG: hypothetical protein QOJ35_667, partial [Solirubrobacteraceae bacterium]|nr:hypothetical protein [Solirubrobacteraceae bacterium]
SGPGRAFAGLIGSDAYAKGNSPGAFYGGAGNDRFTGDIFAGTFYGGDGDDFAHLLADGAYDGGAGFDTLEFLGGGTCTNVELGC